LNLEVNAFQGIVSPDQLILQRLVNPLSKPFNDKMFSSISGFEIRDLNGLRIRLFTYKRVFDDFQIFQLVTPMISQKILEVIFLDPLSFSERGQRLPSIFSRLIKGGSEIDFVAIDAMDELIHKRHLFLSATP
jgi:hypothetical protein